MPSFLKTHWIYIVIGFATVLVAIIGFLILQRVKTQQEVNQQIAMAPAPGIEKTTPPTELTNIDFSVTEPTPEPGTESKPSCVNMTATPPQGTVPATITFTVQTQGVQGKGLVFAFDFGDEKTQSVERLITNPKGTEVQNMSHTYTEPGMYQVTVAVSYSDNGGSSYCEGQVAISGIANEEAASESAQTLTPTTAPKQTAIAYPTTAENESIPVPNVPVAGGLVPTAAAAVGGIVILLLAFIL